MINRAAAVAGGAVVRSGVLSMAGLVAVGATRLVHGSLVSRATDHETFAVVGTLISLAMTASLSLPGGLASAASRFIPFHAGRGEASAARAAYRAVTVAGYACAALLGAAVAGAATTLPGVGGADAAWVGALTAIYSAYSVAKGALYGFDRIVAYTWLEIAGSVVAVVATVAVISAGAHAYLAPLTAGYAVLMLGSLAVLARRTGRGRVGRDRMARHRTVHDGPAPGRRALAAYAGLAAIGGLASAGLLQVLPVVAGRFTTPIEVSYFVAAVTLVAPLYLVPRALGLALFPAMARAHGAGDVAIVRHQADVSTRALLVLLAPVFAAGFVLAPEVLAVFGGSGYAGGADVLRILLLATYVAVVPVAAVNALSSGDGVRVPVYSALAGAAAGLLGLLVLGRFGAAGVSLSYLVAVLGGAAGPLVVTWRRFGMDWSAVTARCAGVLVAGLIAARLTEISPYGSVRTAVDILAAVAVGGAAALLLRRDIAAVLAARTPTRP